MKKKSIIACFSLLCLLCATMCFGVYVATPLGTNRLDGIINVGLADVEIYTLVNNNAAAKIGAANYSSNKTSNSVIDLSTLEESSPKTIKLVINNLTTSQLGVYFYSGEEAKTTTSPAESSDIRVAATIDGCISVSFSSYTELPASGTAEMIITFSLISGSNLEDKDLSFNYFLNIEDYQFGM